MTGLFQEDAFYKRHSTMGEAVGIAKRMGAKHVVLTHFSSRYCKIPPIPDYLIEAGNISVASDFMVARFNELEHLPKLLPLYRQLYSRELSELGDRLAKRELRKAEDEMSS
jgi:ribonuclease Z